MSKISRDITAKYIVKLRPGVHELPGGITVDLSWPLEKVEPIAKRYPQYFELKPEKPTKTTGKSSANKNKREKE